MKHKLLLFAAAFAFLAFAASALADDPVPPGWISSPPPTSISGPSTTSAPNPFGPQCSLKSISYQLVLKSKPYLMLRSDGGCADTAHQWSAWQFAGKTSFGWTLQGYSYKNVLLVPLTGVKNHLRVSLTIGQGDGFSNKSCSFITFGLNGTKLCH
jgi:hypothetical protein